MRDLIEALRIARPVLIALVVAYTVVILLGVWLG